jgi:hypothetical protein
MSKFLQWREPPPSIGLAMSAQAQVNLTAETASPGAPRAYR